MSAGHDLIQATASLGGRSISEPGDTVEYENDDPASGMVVFRRKNGTPFMWMNAKDYEAMVEKSRTMPEYRFTVKL